MWPEFLMNYTILKYSLMIIVISLILKTIIYRFFLHRITIAQAFLFSLIGNITATITGIFLTTAFGAIIRTGIESIVAALITDPIMIFKITNFIVYLIIAAVEIYTIKGLAHAVHHRYSTKQLLPPVILGDFITYATLAAYMAYSGTGLF